jgi:signal transduction histidine kinase
MITARLRGLPIRHKLVAMIMITSAAVLVLSSVGYLVNDYIRLRRVVRIELETQARIVLENSIAAVDYHDEQSALDTLRTLTTNRFLTLACLYTADGVEFVGYVPGGRSGGCGSSPPADGSYFGVNSLSVVASFWRDGKRAGSVHLASTLGMIWERLRTQLVVVLLVLLLALFVALVLSSQLQSLVSDPVRSLAGTAGEVSAGGDYSLRARRTTDDELGQLVDAFNRMLDRIQLREAELSKTNDELRREIVERQRAEQERAELLVREREANRLKDEFLATLSHELRTPLNAILGWTRLLRAHAVAEAAVDTALEKVERNAQIQARLVEDLLEVSRITSGKLHLEQREVDLVTIVNRALDSIRPAAQARGVDLHRRFSDASLQTVGDPDRLQQVVWNLLSNAVKFTGTGGTIMISLARVGEIDELAVSDTGIGITPEFLPYVFDTFRQADASSTRAHGGLGLGLSIVRHLVEMHGGTVTASSTGPNEGATFTVRLPVRRLSATFRETAVEPPAAAALLAGINILVVDDHADTREILASVFESAGARVRTAPSAVDALAAALESAPDVLISDIAMPGGDGVSLMEQLKQALGKTLPVSIALTAFASEPERARTAAAGYHRHIAKPFDPLALVRVVEELLGGGTIHA